jgi:hypothetical protein
MLELKHAARRNRLESRGEWQSLARKGSRRRVGTMMLLAAVGSSGIMRTDSRVGMSMSRYTAR